MQTLPAHKTGVSSKVAYAVLDRGVVVPLPFPPEEGAALLDLALK